MLNYRSNGRRRLERPVKSLLDEAEKGRPLELGDSSAVGRGRAGYITGLTTTNSTAITTLQR